MLQRGSCRNRYLRYTSSNRPRKPPRDGLRGEASDAGEATATSPSPARAKGGSELLQARPAPRKRAGRSRYLSLFPQEAAAVALPRGKEKGSPQNKQPKQKSFPSLTSLQTNIYSCYKPEPGTGFRVCFKKPKPQSQEAARSAHAAIAAARGAAEAPPWLGQGAEGKQPRTPKVRPRLSNNMVALPSPGLIRPPRAPQTPPATQFPPSTDPPVPPHSVKTPQTPRSLRDLPQRTWKAAGSLPS